MTKPSEVARQAAAKMTAHAKFCRASAQEKLGQLTDPKEGLDAAHARRLSRAARYPPTEEGLKRLEEAYAKFDKDFREMLRRSKRLLGSGKDGPDIGKVRERINDWIRNQGRFLEIIWLYQDEMNLRDAAIGANAVAETLEAIGE